MKVVSAMILFVLWITKLSYKKYRYWIMLKNYECQTVTDTFNKLSLLV